HCTLWQGTLELQYGRQTLFENGAPTFDMGLDVPELRDPWRQGQLGFALPNASYSTVQTPANVVSYGQTPPSAEWHGTRAALLLLPMWLIVLVFAIPAGWLWFSAFRRARRPGHCRRCGYD